MFLRMCMLTVCVFSAVSFAALSVGGNLLLEFNNGARTTVQNGTRQNEQDWSTFNFELTPSVLIRVSDLLEVAPRIGFMFHRPDNGDDNAGVLVGCGLYFHVLERDPFALSLGPDLSMPILFGDNFIDWTASLGLPLNLDFLISEKLTLRVGFRLVEMYYHKTSWDNAQEQEEHTGGFAVSYTPSPYFGFYVNF